MRAARQTRQKNQQVWRKSWHALAKGVARFLSSFLWRWSSRIVWKIAPLLNYTQKASDETRALPKDVLATASEVRKKREKMMTFVTWLSYVLYTLGWGLGFAGRFYGVNDLSGAE